jgi:hypothetical protein
MRRLILVLVAAAALASCVGVESTITLSPNGSGTLSLMYRVSQFVADMGSSTTEKTAVPLPLSREDFLRGLQDARGVSLKSFRRTADEKDIIITAELAFDSVDSLAKLAAFHDALPSLTSTGGRKTFTQPIVKAAAAEMTPDTLQMIDAFYSDYAVAVRVHAPSPILSSSVGELSADKRTVTYTASVKDLIVSKRDVVMTVTW